MVSSNYSNQEVSDEWARFCNNVVAKRCFAKTPTIINNKLIWLKHYYYIFNYSNENLDNDMI